ncbi:MULTISPECIES: HlyD family type I secretion periplasmic adaptor subunit [unclassified Duganella]|uniref:HlyD family type I secretion periplasmic adaptor subunit n=1 Tax=unclassified Duganella TaxID=2636909 RepID=UPI000E34AD2C|nr:MULTISPECIES: HlyD family type I secretion periplasmic adaptor subunit [unclassified Duganella]RFP14602.1 HlyD family type I secretion periplasmic adaptor subunit [Duganella sp. BJB475]RFP30950.1 HlyD family type I secretion periplasmic adaptor subunit [Duganella sp. BJB476]
MLLETLRLWRDIAGAALAQQRQAAPSVARTRDELAFLPAALEVLETPASPAGRALMWALMALFTIALGWSVVGRLDVVAVSQGKLVAAGKSKVIQPLEAAIVRRILVDNGQHVNAGQLLVELDATQVDAELGKSGAARADAQLAAARAQALLDAQAQGRPPRLAPLDGLAAARRDSAQRMADGLYAEYGSRLLAMRAELQKRGQELQTVRAKVAALQQIVPLARTQEADFRALLAQNYVSRHAVQEKELGRIQQEQELATQQGVARELEAGLQEQRQNIETAVAQFRREQLDALTQAQQALAQLSGDVAKAQQTQRQTRLLAPVAGTVQQLAIHTVGGVVTPAQELLVLVPDEAALEVEVQVLNQDIGFVRAGQGAEVKLDAFPYTHYGTLPGTVLSLSQDAVKDDKLGLVYPARIRLGARAIQADGRAVALASGMAATVEIKTEQRRIIEYFLAPLQRYRRDALRER